MAKAKVIFTEARVGTERVFHTVSRGMGSKRDAILAAMELMDAIGKPGEIRQQEGGAKGWAVYSYTPGDRAAHLNPQSDWRLT